MSSPRLTRALEVLKLAAASPVPLSLKAIGETLKIERSMLSRIVSDLIVSGFLEKCTYRTVCASPEFAVMGKMAGEHHPAARTAAELLLPRLAELHWEGAFAVIAGNELHYFFCSSPAVKEPIWRSDLAAVIWAESHTPWEEAERLLRQTLPPDSGAELGRFRLRMEEAAEKHHLAANNAGRSWSITVPLVWRQHICALSLSGSGNPGDMGKVQFECSRLAAKLRSAGESMKDSR